MSGRTIWRRMLDLDHRWIASGIFAIIAYMIISPIAIPFPVSSYGQAFYDFVEGIPAGETVGFMMGDSVSTKPQLKPATTLAMYSIWEKGGGIVFWYDTADSVNLLVEYIDDVEKMLGYELEYGVDYVDLGYIAGAETGQVALLESMRGLLGGVDRNGIDLDSMPIMDGIDNGGDFNYGLFNCACACTEPMYIRQWGMPYGTKVASINCAMDLPAITLYLATGQLEATANGLLGSAEMEYLTGNLGLAFGQTLAVSFAGLYFTILVILGNLFYFIDRSQGGGQ
jgi:hypothetical protein